LLAISLFGCRRNGESRASTRIATIKGSNANVNNRVSSIAAKGALDQQTQTTTTTTTTTAALACAQTAIAQLGTTDPQKKTLNPKLVNPRTRSKVQMPLLGTLQVWLCDVDQRSGFNISRPAEEG